ncbi:PREDICTED: cathepsin L-like proteinase [Camelina sativa]|uniref:Cathepsin L-like proteinase n=1 Tax=Camelina sativa TaxID=90675 RepID=A0ABM0SY37_CAMSA|nr:PREDICTED: cathepsin L-like proteinase [Camelina sativa]
MDQGRGGIGAKPKRQNAFAQAKNQGIIGDVLDQVKDYCWAIVFARLMQAIYNQGLPTTLQHEFSFLELVDHIKPKEFEKFALANLKIAFDHIASHGIMKKPVKRGNERASSKGLRIKKTFHLYEDVYSTFIREELDKYPVGLILKPTLDFAYIGKEVYNLPKKVVTPSSTLHCILLIGYGVTQQGKLFFIGQNSWGTDWGCRGYVRIIIDELCDIISLK